MSKKIDLTGRKFMRLEVIKESEARKNGSIVWICKCDCGNIIKARSCDLIRANTKSCGCLNIQKAKQNISRNIYFGENNPFYKHGGSLKGKKERLYQIWEGMKNRCYNKNMRSYINYGGKGICVHPEWRDDYKNFRLWALSNGYKDGLTIDRINNYRSYDPENCQWLSRSENTRKSHIDRRKASSGLPMLSDL